MIGAAVVPVLATASVALADGNFDGGQLPVGGVRAWAVAANWGFDIPPMAADSLVFGDCGDGILDLGGIGHAHPSATFEDWVTYTIGVTAGDLLSLDAPGLEITVGASVSSTYGSDYFADGTNIVAALELPGGANTIFFSHANTGTLRIQGDMAPSASPLILARVAAGTNNRGVYFDSPNFGYSGDVTITTGTSARLLCTAFAPGGRTGTGVVNLAGGEFHILSDLPFAIPPGPPFTPDQFVTNAIVSSSGTIRADHNYTAAPLAAYAPGSQHILGAPGLPPPLVGAAGPAITVDNPAFIGGTNDASITFTADNGQNFGTYSIVLGNAAFAPPGALGTRTVTVSNGSRREGIAGSILRTSINRLDEKVVTVQVQDGFPFAGPGSTLFDFNPATGAGIELIKAGTGVLSIAGDNTVFVFPGVPASQGFKTVLGGVLRFMMPASYGFTPGPVPFPYAPGPSPVTLSPVYPVYAPAGPPPPATAGIPVSAAMGVGYDTAPPPNMWTTGGIPGQSGAFDIDFLGHTIGFGLGTFNIYGGPTAWRVGSSGAGATTAPIGPYDDFGLGVSTYFLGGGGGTLTLSPAPGFGPGAFPTSIEMGTSGLLLPGRVALQRPTFHGGPTNIRAGTLQVPPGPGPGPGAFAFVLAGSTFTSVGTYSTGLSANGVYIGAPAATPYNGPGQLLLSAADAAGGFYFYGPGGNFGIGPGLSLDGGAIGYDGAVGLGPLMAALPGLYNSTGFVPPMPSSIYGSIVAPAPPAAPTHILHLGGEYSAGVMTVPAAFPIMNNAITGLPVALIKSGNDSVLDLTLTAGNPYTGGTAILGGEIMVDSPGQLGPLPGPGPTAGAVVIADGGILHVVPGGPPGVMAFPSILRVTNGPERRASTVMVEPGLIANFTAAVLQAGGIGSVLQKTGGGILELTTPFLGPTGDAANTWGIRATGGLVVTNQLPGIITPLNGAAVFDGGTFALASPPAFGASPIPGFPYVMAPAPFVVPAGIQGSPGYGYSSLQSYAGTASAMFIGNGAVFRTTGGATTSLMGALTVTMGPASVFKFGQSPAGDDARGTGSINFSGGNVQFNPGGPDILFPRDGAFTLSLNYGAQFSGTALADITGNLLFNNLPGSPAVTIDGATVSPGGAPVTTPATWTIEGTGLTSWAGTVTKGTTFAVPPAAGSFATGTVTINRCVGAPVSIAAGASLVIAAGTFNAGGTGDPFTDTATLVNLPVTNNAVFNITEGFKNVASLAGLGVTTVAIGAFLDVGSMGPVAQSTFNVNGMADVGNLDVSGTTTLGAGATLASSYIRGNTLSIAAGAVATIKPDGTATGTSKLTTLAIAAGGTFDIDDNDLIITSTSYATVESYVIAGFGSFDWLGTGITSATAATYAAIDGSRAVGVIDNADWGHASFGGQTVNGTDILVKYTWVADSNVDGLVDNDDFGQFLYGFNGGGSARWLNGDFDYNGVVDNDDFGWFLVGLGAFQASGNMQLSEEFRAELASFASEHGLPLAIPVPEPASIGLLALATLAARRRRKRP